jgi:hypothetical protein
VEIPSRESHRFETAGSNGDITGIDLETDVVAVCGIGARRDVPDPQNGSSTVSPG